MKAYKGEMMNLWKSVDDGRAELVIHGNATEVLSEIEVKLWQFQ